MSDCQGSRDTGTHCPHWFEMSDCCACRRGHDWGDWCSREPIPSWALQYADTLIPGRGARGINLRDDDRRFHDRRVCVLRVALALTQTYQRGAAPPTHTDLMVAPENVPSYKESNDE